jgi:hypothetical protein
LYFVQKPAIQLFFASRVSKFTEPSYAAMSPYFLSTVSLVALLSAGLAVTRSFETAMLDMEENLEHLSESAIDMIAYVPDQDLPGITQNLTDLSLSNHKSINPRTPPTKAPVVGGLFASDVRGVELDASCSDEQLEFIADAWHNAYLMADEAARVSRDTAQTYQASGSNDNKRNAWLMEKWPA